MKEIEPGDFAITHQGDMVKLLEHCTLQRTFGKRRCKVQYYNGMTRTMALSSLRSLKKMMAEWGPDAIHEIPM